MPGEDANRAIVKNTKRVGIALERREKTGNETLAAQATETLMMGNTLIAIGLRAGKMPLTAEALEIAKDGFREQVYLSLMADPALCRTILKGGSAGARVSLILAYASLASIIVPTAMMELQVRRA